MLRKKMYSFASALALVLALLASGTGSAQTVVVGPNGKVAQTFAPGANVAAAAVADGRGGTRVVSAAVGDSPEPVIVQLRSAPLAQRSASTVAARNAIAAEQGRVRAEIERLQRSRTQGTSLPAAIRAYSVVFNGLAATLSPAEQAVLRKHADVKAIFPDVEMKALQDWGVDYVGAPDFWAAHSGYRGAGMVIAVIDTGIDYTHADLGGCGSIGGGCKVIGGYDFYNNDGDPADDNGHGTHVAATAAGNGSFVGVAPDASLLAYKVLGAGGSGPSSIVIAGIERAVDPDGDLDPSDHADVINLSLGAPFGNADDPSSQAVDAATAAGVFVAAAAGNDGGYLLTGSPGTARTALTVGAVDDSGAVASFTSGGPSPVIYGLKPEIAAPGVGICAARANGTALGATCVDSTHIQISGTSMATPHVAGAAALLRGVFPALSVADVKSLMVQNSVGTGLDPLKVGAGVLDLPAAASANTVVSPAAISFGRDDVTQATWVTSQFLTVKNLDSVSRSYSLSASGYFWGLPSGATLSFSPSSFSLGAGATTDVTVQLSVDNAIAPSQPLPPHVYDAMISLTSGAETQRIPVIFLKASLLRVHTPDQQPTFIIVHDRMQPATGYSVTNPSTTSVDFDLLPGTYDVQVFYYWGNKNVVHEGVTVDSFREETVNASEAVYTVSLSGVDENGQPLSGTGTDLYTFYHRGNFSGWVAGKMPGNEDPPSANAFSSSYALDAGLQRLSANKTYVVAKGVVGLSANQALVNTPAELRRGEIRYHEDPGATVTNAYSRLLVQLSWGGLIVGESVPGPNYDVYTTGEAHDNFPVAAQTSVELTGEWHNGPVFRGATGGIEAFNSWPDVSTPFVALPWSPVVYATSTEELPLNLGPASFFARIAADASTTLDLSRSGGNYTFHFQGGDGPRVPGAGGGWPPPGTVPIRFLANGNVSGGAYPPQSSPQFGIPPYWPGGGTGGPGYLSAESDRVRYWTGGVRASSHMAASFGNADDLSPPYFGPLSVRSNGALTDVVATGATATLWLEAFDDLDQTGVSVSIRQLMESGEVPLAVSQVGDHLFEAVVACGAEAGSVNLEVAATDSSGNRIREWLNPAFVCRPPTCGDGSADPGEACDDGNTVSGDGCNAICSSTENCGDGVIDAGEDCDDGNQLDGDCCSSSCEFEPAGSACEDDGLFCNGLEVCDASGTCARHLNPPCAGLSDNCTACNEATDACLSSVGVVCRPASEGCDPVEYCDGVNQDCPGDIGPSDTDGDGRCDLEDPCTNVGGGRNFLAKSLAVFTKINTETVPGNDKMRVKATFELPAGVSFADLQPELRGARVVVEAADGSSRLDAVLGPGVYGGKGTRGWKRSRNGRSLVYKDKTVAPIDGVAVVVLKDKSNVAPNLVAIKVVGKNGVYPIVAGDEPINVILGIGDQDDAIAGLCGEGAYGPAECGFNRAGTTLRCKR